MKANPAFSALLILVCVLPATSQQVWHYDLRPGDHLVYSYVVDRDVSSGEGQIHTKAIFNTHVLVLGENKGHLSVGFQRNRESVQLIEYREHGKDKLKQELPDFEQTMSKRPVRFEEANEFSITGEALTYWQAAREDRSKIMMAVHEIETLPSKAVNVGDKWQGHNLLGLEFHVAAPETISGKACIRVEGSRGEDRLTYWWCPAIGTIGKVEVDGTYSIYESTVHEKLSFELQDKKHNETAAEWLKSPDMQLGTMNALLVSRWVPIQPNLLDSALQSSDAQVQADALAVIYQRRLEWPDRDLVKLAQSSDAQVKRIAKEILDPVSPQPIPQVGKCTQPAHTYPAERPGTSLRFMRSEKYRGEPYMLHIPIDYRGNRPFPLLVYLSGGAGLAMDAVNTAEDVIAPSGYLVIYPQAGDFWWKPETVARFAALFEEVLQDLNVDRDRVYISGFSNGGTGSLYYATLWPQRFAAVVTMMGAGVCNSEIADQLANVANLPIQLIHGDQDPIIDPSCSQATFDAVRKLPPKLLPALHMLKGRGHEITLDGDDGLTLPFVADKLRTPWPAKITAKFADTTYPRQYWVELVAKKSGLATIEGQIKPDNTIELTTKNILRVRLLLRPEMFSSTSPIKVVLNKTEIYHRELEQDCALLQQSSAGSQDSSLGYTQALEFDVSP